MIPFTTLPNSTKFVSVVTSGANLASVNVNLSLSAPGEFSFVVPCALSSKLVSAELVISSSLISKPIL